MSLIAHSLAASLPTRFRRLHTKVSELLDNYSLVSFQPLDIGDEESIAAVLSVIDHAIQYGEDADVRAASDVPT
jgi:hypothetical protein